jgi:hypothetical protein
LLGPFSVSSARAPASAGDGRSTCRFIELKRNRTDLVGRGTGKARQAAGTRPLNGRYGPTTDLMQASTALHAPAMHALKLAATASVVRMTAMQLSSENEPVPAAAHSSCLARHALNEGSCCQFGFWATTAWVVHPSSLTPHCRFDKQFAIDESTPGRKIGFEDHCPAQLGTQFAFSAGVEASGWHRSLRLH